MSILWYYNLWCGLKSFSRFQLNEDNWVGLAWTGLFLFRFEEIFTAEFSKTTLCTLFRKYDIEKYIVFVQKQKNHILINSSCLSVIHNLKNDASVHLWKKGCVFSVGKHDFTLRKTLKSVQVGSANKDLTVFSLVN